MKNKLLAFIVVFALVTPVFAQVPDKVEAGVTPDSIFYGVDVFLDDLDVRLTGNFTEKIDKQLRNIQERKSEMIKMAQQNKSEDMEKAKDEMRNEMNRIENNVRERSQKMLGNNESAEKMRQTFSRVEEKLQKHSDTLEEVKGQVPEEAKEGLNTALENSRRVFDNINTKSVKTMSDVSEKDMTDLREQVVETGRGKKLPDGVQNK